MAESETQPVVLQFAAFQSFVDEGFWRRLSSLKLDTLGIDQSPIHITGFYAPCSYAQISNQLTLLHESLPPEPGEQSSSSSSSKAVITAQGNRNRCPVPGILYNTNTLESYHSLDKQSLLKAEATKIWEDIRSGKAEEDSAVLSRFLLISFADLKKWSFHYWFAFPALVLDPPATLIDLMPASKCFTLEEAESLSAACNEWRSSSLTAGVPFFLVTIDSDSHATISPLRDWAACQGDGKKLLFGFYDPCHLPNNPGWPLRNFLALICSRWNMKKVRFLCYREKHGFADLRLSLVGEVLVSVPQGWNDPQHVPNAVGWELYKGKTISRCINLAKSMDPTRLAISAADLNLKLMRWRALPSLNLNKLSSLKCLLLGAGTLGCQVARMLMAWGVRKITMVDSGRVAMSNPLRQSLYTFDDCLNDCLNGGTMKAMAAVNSLKRIFPAVEADGVVMAIPMPGHPVPTREEDNVLEDCRHLQDLIASHDAVFLLTDTRESRWLPTLLCANSNKITITAALGFDSYVVMRHGAGPLSSPNIEGEGEDVLSAPMGNLSTEGDERKRLGCYFCNDVVAPIDSTANRTLDQQCTVTRPGLAPIASAIAVELLVGILHHPDGILAPGDISSSNIGSSEQPLGILPHQIRGSISQFSQMTLLGHSSNSCTACCSTVVSEYRKRGMDFVLQAINHPTYLEDVTGLTELMKSASSFNLDWDNETDEFENDDDDAKEIVQHHTQKNGHWSWRIDNANEMKAVSSNLLPREYLEESHDPQHLMDPTRLAISAADLNLKLMRCALPSLNLNNLSTLKCLLLGAGTLGCQVARMLMAWGVWKITMVDSGRVAMSNPLRQSLYTFDDCLNGGTMKAMAAVNSLKRIFPAVEADGVVMAIPMPGHPVPTREEDNVLEDCRHLQDLIASHDAVFLLTDTRESRWLPTLLCANSNKITITAALGFDSYVVMRHGAGPLSSPNIEGEGEDALSAQMGNLSTEGDERKRLGCYFCNDVVAPIDSTANRTLDQQCTVTRPGLAPIASAIAVELLVGILHHPDGILAPGDISSSNIGSSEQPLGILPHQIRGSISQFSQMTLLGHSSNSCTACCSTVVSEYRKRGMDFVLQAINHPTYLEDVTGLTELMKSASSFNLDWDNETDEFENDDDGDALII